MSVKKLKAVIFIDDLLEGIDPYEWVAAPKEGRTYEFGRALTLSGVKEQKLVIEIIEQPFYE